MDSHMLIYGIRKEVFGDSAYEDDDILVTRAQLVAFAEKFMDELIFEFFNRIEDMRLR